MDHLRWNGNVHHVRRGGWGWGQGQEKTASWPSWTMGGIFNPKDIPNAMYASSAAALLYKHTCVWQLKDWTQTECSKEQNVQKLDIQFQMKQRSTCITWFFNMECSCLIIYAPLLCWSRLVLVDEMVAVVTHRVAWRSEQGWCLCCSLDWPHDCSPDSR